jgi:hypothetical protein
MNEQATMTGRAIGGPGVGFGIFMAGLAGAFLAGALAMWVLSAVGGSTVGTAGVVAQVGANAGPFLTDVPTPASVPPLRRAHGGEYRRIPDDGSGSGFATGATAVPVTVGHHGDEDRRIPGDTP